MFVPKMTTKKTARSKYEKLARKAIASKGLMLGNFKGCWIGNKYMVAIIDNSYFQICLNTFSVVNHINLRYYK